MGFNDTYATEALKVFLLYFWKNFFTQFSWTQGWISSLILASSP